MPCQAPSSSSAVSGRTTRRSTAAYSPSEVVSLLILARQSVLPTLPPVSSSTASFFTLPLPSSPSASHEPSSWRRGSDRSSTGQLIETIDMALNIVRESRSEHISSSSSVSSLSSEQDETLESSNNNSNSDHVTMMP